MYPILLSCAKACRWAPPPTNNQAFAPQVPLCSAEQSRAEVAERNKRRRLLEVKTELRRGREEERRGEKQRREEEPTMVPRGRGREMQGGPLTLERYHRFFVDPWGTRLTIDHLNHIISMHGFVKLHRSNKGDIMRRLVGQVDLQPPRRSTLHRAAEGPPSDAVIAADVVSADVDAIGWTECPIGSVAVLAASPGDAPEPVEPDPRPADFVLAGRRARSKRSRSSAYGHRPPEPDDGGSSMEVEEKEDGEWLPPSPSTPPRWTRSPTPPPPPPSPPHATPPPPPPPPPREMVAPPPPPPPPYYGQPTLAPPPPPPPPYCGHPTLAPLPPRPLHFGASPARLRSRSIPRRDSDLSGAHRRCRRVTRHHSGARRSGVLNLRRRGRRRCRTGATSDRRQLQCCISHLLPPCSCSSSNRRRRRREFSGAGRRIREGVHC
ncbi:hypothetical protein EE612_016984 [Oryza sativa]|nr:hypothetical protein EE612_016984 [Oryza sativa]